MIKKICRGCMICEIDLSNIGDQFEISEDKECEYHKCLRK